MPPSKQSWGRMDKNACRQRFTVCTQKLRSPINVSHGHESATMPRKCLCEHPGSRLDITSVGHESNGEQSMTPRQAVRFNIYRPVSFCSGATDGEGTVVDISQSGCRVKSDVPMDVGSRICMFIVVPSGLMPITIGMATVRWANNGEFACNSSE